ncbi:bifunctional adenosylcobinamide kinase/adenosylcobinamide-phosphate guanylyltransferase [Dietzia aurantiaca]|uniref:bifunctional adenosylcobinamide kinase/adenosylcobinamide-phosphate guanylyltransferase n=1 Tax=Dietzia aurantiaca TaxID=983873 RepID=UPI001E56D1B4|nr:bifunctional adenosylcobinamide kinase/adenosylcobinamide-phosphate guanylyltransferase [Dietzia aurantiaca]MCD2262215.1 bifunctional adenosylcobinamide kinase/adenosylcobinamide-phosphate guanylyltransferase [Dietzia aurantiaca]
MRVLVTGGARSGKSRHAARLLEDRTHTDPPRPGDPGHNPAPVTFIAPGRPADELDDPDWAARVRHHRAHRPAEWHTVETADVAAALRATPGPVLVDCLGTWLTGCVDRLGLWDAPVDEARPAVDARVTELCEALAGHDDVVLVTNEVGSGVVPAHRAGGVFRDLLGALNQTVAAQCHEVHLVVCGRVLVL